MFVCIEDHDVPLKKSFGSSPVSTCCYCVASPKCPISRADSFKTQNTFHSCGSHRDESGSLAVIHASVLISTRGAQQAVAETRGMD